MSKTSPESESSALRLWPALVLLAARVGETWNHPVLVGDRLYAYTAEEVVAMQMPVD